MTWLREMQKVGEKPTTVTYNCLINGAAKQVYLSLLLLPSPPLSLPFLPDLSILFQTHSCSGRCGRCGEVAEGDEKRGTEAGCCNVRASNYRYLLIPSSCSLYFILFYFILFHFISFHFISFHFILFYFILLIFISVVANAGDIAGIQKWINQMISENLKPTLSTFRALVSGTSLLLFLLSMIF